MNFLKRSWVSSWITPSGTPPRRASKGTHITERMRQSAILCDRSKRWSLEASSLSSDWPVSRQRLTILRLKRAPPSSLARRVRSSLGMSLPSSWKMTKARSAWRKTWKMLSTIFGRRASSLIVCISSPPSSMSIDRRSAGCDSSTCLLDCCISVASTVEESSSSSSGGGVLLPLVMCSGSGLFS